MICQQTILSYFNPSLPTTIQVDASGANLGDMLLQNNPLIYFASRSLSEVEQRYPNIEQELLTVVYGCQRFHYYIYGSSFKVESDYKLFSMITLKHIALTRRTNHHWRSYI